MGTLIREMPTGKGHQCDIDGEETSIDRGLHALQNNVSDAADGVLTANQPHAFPGSGWFSRITIEMSLKA